MNILDDEYWRDREVEEKLQLANGTLAVWRSKKRYPELRYVKVGRSVRYPRSVVERFLAERMSK